MAANQNPIFPVNANNGAFGVVMTTGANNYDGTSGTAVLLFTAQTNGSYVFKVVCRPIGTNVATVLRLWLNNGSTNGTASNNIFLIEFSLPATAASATAALQPYEFALNINIAAGYKIYGVLGTTVAAGYAVSVHGGDY